MIKLHSLGFSISSLQLRRRTGGQKSVACDRLYRGYWLNAIGVVGRTLWDITSLESLSVGEKFNWLRSLQKVFWDRTDSLEYV